MWDGWLAGEEDVEDVKDLENEVGFESVTTDGYSTRDDRFAVDTLHYPLPTTSSTIDDYICFIFRIKESNPTSILLSILAHFPKQIANPPRTNKNPTYTSPPPLSHGIPPIFRPQHTTPQCPPPPPTYQHFPNPHWHQLLAPQYSSPFPQKLLPLQHSPSIQWRLTIGPQTPPFHWFQTGFAVGFGGFGLLTSQLPKRDWQPFPQ